MSSSNSSEDEHELIYSNYNTNERIPWYPMFGQPLIYYAQIQPKRHKRTKDQKKDTPNCFMKAFHWYTQERALKNRNSKNNNMKDFATWLDDKYDEFLQGGRTQYIRKEKSTVGIVNSLYTRHQGSTLRTKDFRTNLRAKRSNQSIEMILNPVNISRAASDSCQRCKSCNHYNDTIQSDRSVVEKKLKPKSQSLTSVFKEREIYVVPFDTVPDDKENTETKNKSPNELSKRNSMVVNKKKYSKNIACQCVHAVSKKADASSQIEKSRSNISSSADMKPTALRKKQIVLQPQPGLIQKQRISIDEELKSKKYTKECE